MNKVTHSTVAHHTLTNAQPDPWPVLLFSLTLYGWNIPLVSWGELSWLCPLPALCAPPASLLARKYKKLKSP